jgi:transposase-like protein
VPGESGGLFHNRWAIRFLPLIEKMARKHKRLVGCNWRTDETYFKVKGAWRYQYRSVDKLGKTVGFLLKKNAMPPPRNAFLSRP